MSSRNAASGIVVGIDDSPAARVAVRWAAVEAEMRHVPLTVVHAVSPEVSTWLKSPVPAGVLRWQQDHGRRLIDEAVKLVEEASQHGGPAGVNTEMFTASAVSTLIDLSKDAEMVVMGAQGSGRWPGRLLGSVTSALLRHAHCPVAIVHDQDPGPAQGQAPILVGIDGSPASEWATAIAFDEASRRRVGLVALHSWTDFDGPPDLPEIDWPATQSMAEEVLAERLAGWQERYPDVQVTRAVVQAQPARELVGQSAQAQLVVVGSRGRGGFAGMLVGSVGETVAQMARVPVVVARESLA